MVQGDINQKVGERKEALLEEVACGCVSEKFFKGL